MRILMWFTIGFALAIAAGVYFLSGWWLIGFMAAALCGSIPLFLLKRKPCVIAGVILVGVSVGMLWQFGFDSLYMQPLRNYVGESVTTVVTVTDYSYATDYGVAADGQIELSGKQYKTRVYVTAEESLGPGDKLQGEFKLRLTTDDSEQGATYHQGKGIFLLSYADKDAKIIPAQKIPLKYFAAKLRHEITEILDRTFPEDTRAFARALLLGDSSLLSYEEDTALKVSGIRHVIAVSGLHVSILIALVYFVSGRRRVLTAILGFPILLLFAAVAGFTPSVVRACIMQGLIILGLLADQEYDPPTSLAFAVLVMLAVNPLTITSVSFQLSVGCLIGIFLFYQPVSRYLSRLLGCEKGMTLKAKAGRWLAGSVSVTISAMTATTPLCALYFGSISLIGVFTNLLTLWMISIVFYGVMLACVVGAVWLPAAKVIAVVVSYPIRYVLFVAKSLSKIPFGAVYTCSPYVVVWLVFAYILFAVFLLCCRKYKLTFLGCTLCGLALSVTLSCVEPRLDPLRVTVLDVGQGQAILLQTEGKNYMVDCGGESTDAAADLAAQTLLSQGVLRLDGLILTHYDTDHAGGAASLLSRVPADKLYLPNVEDQGSVRKELVEHHSDRIIWIEENTVLDFSDASLTLLPAPEAAAAGNESCLCILFQGENCDILITGDGSVSWERALLENIDLPELELLVVGHHGSNSSTGLELLHATKPKTAVISVGKDNSYGHPNEAVLKRLRLFGCKIWRTDLDGTIIFKG